MMHRHPPAVWERGHLPDKLFYKIGEVSQLTGIPAYILRYWESEFEVLQPKKSRGGQRLYRKRDLETVFQIQRLLYRDGFTIAGAKTKIRSQGSQQVALEGRYQTREEVSRSLRTVREGLEKIVSLLKEE